MRNKNFFQSVICAVKGIITALIEERNLRFDFAAALAAGVLAYAGNFDRTEWAVLILIIAAVICAELFNTAIERTVDIRSKGYDKNAEKAKNTAAGAVIFTAVCAVVIGVLLFADYERMFLAISNIVMLPRLRFIAIFVGVVDVALVFVAPVIIDVIKNKKTGEK